MLSVRDPSSALFWQGTDTCHLATLRAQGPLIAGHLVGDWYWEVWLGHEVRGGPPLTGDDGLAVEFMVRFAFRRCRFTR